MRTDGGTGGDLPRVSRRGFLLGAAAAAGTLATGGIASAAPGVAGGGEDLVPGELVTVTWPPGADAERAVLVHRREGVETRVVPDDPTGILVRRTAIVAIPPDGRLRPGRHDFFVELPGGRRVWLGGYTVSRFRFGS